VSDFHFVCTDFFAYDLAVTANAWCFTSENKFDEERFKSILKGYELVRPLGPEERHSLPLLLRGAALRFTLSRAEEYIEHKPESLMVPKNPLTFLQRLAFFQTYFCKEQEKNHHAAAGN
jgi:homoserine kinase type II